MIYNNNDVIIARSTPIGVSALAMIRISGQNLDYLLKLILKSKKVRPRYNYLVDFMSFSESPYFIDSCVVVYYKGPKSFSGEDMIEISCHGSDFIVNSIINEFIAVGLRVAYPGEFSYRSFMNGKIDLLQAESIASKISLNSNLYGVALKNVENGDFSKSVSGLRDKLFETITIIEHELDFNEEEITHISTNKIISECLLIQNKIESILKKTHNVKKINEGYNVAILGYPNVGKSSLFNRIVGSNKAIVTSIEGTTRDILEANVSIENIPFTFYDTAGYRQSTDKIETMGIEKSIDLIKKSDVVIIMDDNNPQSVYKDIIEKNQNLENKHIIFVKSKCDNYKNIISKNFIPISSLKNKGIDSLLTNLLTIASDKIDKGSFSNGILCSERQILLFTSAQKIISSTISCLKAGQSMDLISLSLREVVDVLDEIIGKVYSDDVLNNIFKGFCVGK